MNDSMISLLASKVPKIKTKIVYNVHFALQRQTWEPPPYFTKEFAEERNRFISVIAERGY